MFLSLNPNSGIPVYRQMIQQFKERIASGQIGVGSQLPSVRELSAQLQINPLTVSKAYQFLERDGWVEFRRGQGTFVTGGRPPLSTEEKEKLIAPALEQLVAEALHLGVSETELQRLIQKTYATKRE